jgi:hypothetical protein
MDKVIKNYDEESAKPMSTKEFIQHLKLVRKEKKARKKHDHGPVEIPQDHVCGPECETGGNVPPPGIETVSLAIVLDDVVADVMQVQVGFGDLLVQNPKFIKLEEGTHRPVPGDVYAEGKFTPFQEIGKKVTIRGF